VKKSNHDLRLLLHPEDITPIPCLMDLFFFLFRSAHQEWSISICALCDCARFTPNVGGEQDSIDLVLKRKYTREFLRLILGKFYGRLFWFSLGEKSVRIRRSSYQYKDNYDERSRGGDQSTCHARAKSSLSIMTPKLQ
jgi:hypothetical protein